jgi:hypothetical protein
MCYCHQTYKWLRYVGSITTNMFCRDRKLNSLQEIGLWQQISYCRYNIDSRCKSGLLLPQIIKMLQHS